MSFTLWSTGFEVVFYSFTTTVAADSLNVLSLVVNIQSIILIKTCETVVCLRVMN